MARKGLVNKNKPPAKKRPRFSANKKKDQRKLDVSDIVDAQQQEQDELKVHGGLLSQKINSDLFVIDKKPLDSSIIETKLSKKEKARSKVAHVEKMINYSKNNKIPAVSKLRSKSNLAEKYQNRSLCRQQNGTKPTMRTKKLSYDIWDDVDQEESTLNLPKKSDGKGIGHGTKKYEKAGKLTSRNFSTDAKNRGIIEDITKAELAGPGQSYQPDKVNHQTLLRKEHSKVISANEKTAKTDRAIAWDTENTATPESTLKEMSQGLEGFDEQEDWSEPEVEEPMVLEEANPEAPKIPKIDDNIPKSAAAKNRYNLEMAKQAKIKAEKQVKHRESQIFNAKRILKDAELEDARILTISRKRKAWKNKQMPRLSATKYSEPDKELKLTDEIKPTLRQLVSEGSILKDRYLSMVKRGVIEPHTVHKRKYMRKYKQKTKVKRAVKNLLGADAILTRK